MVRNLYLPLFALLIMVSASGCFNIIEKLQLNKDGSGEWELTIDMSGMMSFMSMMAEEGYDSEGQSENEVIKLRDLPDSLMAKLEYPEISKNGSVSFTADTEKEIMEMGWKLSFNSVSDIPKFMADSEIAQDAMEGGSFLEDMTADDEEEYDDEYEEEEDEGGFFGGDTEPYLFWKSGELSRVPSESMNFSYMMGEEDGDDESMEMMKMFFSDATYTVEYTLPGKIMKVSDPSYTVKGKVVSKDLDFLDMIEGKEDGSINIKYK